MDVFTVSWDPEDHIQELCKILKDGGVDSAEKNLVEYVVDSIEPAGWRAAWRPDFYRAPPGTSKLNYDFLGQHEYIVDVLDVSQEKLEATVEIVSSVAEFIKSLKNLSSCQKNQLDMKPKSCLIEGDEEDTVRKISSSSPTQEKKVRRCDVKQSSGIITGTKVHALSELRKQNDLTINHGTEMDVDEMMSAGSENSNVEQKFINIDNSKKFSESQEKSLDKANSIALAAGTIINVRVWELTPLVEQENHVLDVETTAEVTALVRFFYKHIFYPWDAEADYCCYNEATIADRHLLYRELQGEVPGIPTAVAAQMHRDVRDAWLALSAIDKLEAACGVRRDGCEVDAGDVQQLSKLHSKLQALREHFEKLRDPVMRELCMQRGTELSQTHNSSGYDSSSAVLCGAANNVWLVGRCSSMKQLQQLMQRLPDLVSKLYPQCTEWNVLLESFLQPALDHCSGGDLLLLLPGHHLLQSLGPLAVAGGAIHGIGDGVIIGSGVGAGDVMMHVGIIDNKLKTAPEAPDLCLRNITLRPLAHQTALLVHSCTVLLDNCFVQGCRGGVIVASESSTADGENERKKRVGVCKVQGGSLGPCEDVGADVREDAALHLTDTAVSSCLVALRLHARAKVSLSHVHLSDNATCAVELRDARDPPRPDQILTSKSGRSLHALDQQHLTQVCDVYEEVTFSDNFCDVAAEADALDVSGIGLMES